MFFPSVDVVVVADDVVGVAADDAVGDVAVVGGEFELQSDDTPPK